MIVFEEDGEDVGIKKGVTHFGFRLIDPKEIEAAADAIRVAGGTILDRGEFIPGEPYLFASDPDGYRIAI